MEKQNFLQRMIGGLKERFGPVHYTAPKEPQYNIPPVIPKDQRQLFIEQAQKVGITPEEFGTIAKREQGANTTAENVALVGGVDPTDKGVMQVNKVNEALIKDRFRNELGREYNPNKAEDSIIASRMVLEENRRIFQQMKINKTYTDQYTNEDLINSYNLGPQGVVSAKQGDKEKLDRLLRYESAGQQ